MSNPVLDLADPVRLTAQLLDIESVSLGEAAIADAVFAALEPLAEFGLALDRIGNNVLARTDFGHASRVILAGHLDTVPIEDNFPSRPEERDGEPGIFGRGAVDMKSGDAVFLHVADALLRARALTSDLTLIFYEAEEIAATANGLGRIEREAPEWLVGDFAVLGEPTAGVIEAGCQGTLRARIVTNGRAAHSARSWLGDNAIHALARALARLAEYRSREVTLDGCTYREGLSAVQISGGVAGNVIPPQAQLTVNFRFAPDRSVAEAFDFVRETFDGYSVEMTDSSPGALPRLGNEPAQRFIATAANHTARGAETFRAKYGWTDVSRFSALGIPAINYGPGDPNLAHTRTEWVPHSDILRAAAVLTEVLSTHS